MTSLSRGRTVNTREMLQEQRREPMTASTTSSMSSEVSVSTEAHLRRKTELIMDYFEDSKK